VAIADDIKPALAAGCRWGGESEQERLLLIPEGAIRVQGTGRAILELCDGRRTFSEILAELQQQYSGADPQRIREDAGAFLEQLQERRVVSF
jgi:pyrroloquinoline quinone biosynthesis protein D